MQDDGEITRLLGCLHDRQPEAEARLIKLIYRELRKIAADRLRREGSVRSLQATARQCQVVEMRFFGRMSEAEIAEALGVSERTINREWRMARAWLQEELSK